MSKTQLVELAGQMEAEAGVRIWEEEIGKNESTALSLLEPSASLGTLLLRSEEPVQHIGAGEKLIASLGEFLSDPKNASAVAEINLLTDRTVDRNMVKILQALAKL